MPPEKQIVLCESCGKLFKPTGIGPHQKSCIRCTHKTNEDLAHFDWLCRQVAQPATNSNNNINDIQVKYHLNAGKPTVKVLFAEFSRGHVPKTYKPDPCTAPWYLFQTHLNFDLSEFIHEAALNREQANCIIKLSKCFHTEDCTLNSYNDLKSSWQAASHHMMAFQKSVISVPFAGEMMEFDVYYCSLWDWACNLLKDSNVGQYFVFDAKHLAKFDGSSFVCFINKPWTANDFWNVQSGLPSDGKVLAFILYTDKSKLSSFGRQKGYPVVAWIANLLTWIHNGEGLGGGRVVKEDKRYSGKKSFTNFKNHVWHESFKKILDTILEYLNTSCWVMCWDGITCQLFPTVLILLADYEEQVEQILAKQGLHDVDSCSDPFQTLCWDRLHANCTGKFGDHLWGELVRILETMGHQMMGKVEWNLSAVPHWHGLNHFEEALSVLYTDGQKFEDLSKIIVFACHDIFPHDMEKDGYLLLCCLHAYIKFDMYTTLELQMTHTLATGWEALVIFNSLMKKYAEKTQYTGKNWNFPKNHTWMHVFDDIKAKGVTHNFNMKLNEKMHGPLKEAYQKQTNFKNVTQQILHIDHLGLMCEHIRCKIMEYNTYMLTAKATRLGSPEADEPEEEFFHIKLGSKMKEPLMFEDMERKSTTDNAFSWFQGKLSKFLNSHFGIAGKPLPGGKCIQFQTNEKITEFCFIKVNFESTVDWCQYMDYLHCHPNFHGHPRYDCVLIKTQQKDIFGRLILLFQCVDKHLNFWRVCKQPRMSSEIISVHSIICGALLYPDHTRPGKYLVVDMVDTDMFLHVQMMHKAAGHL
ncbi:hypothetical protein BKA82DRAFT_4326433 [Pisolithus tinctorius]|nr:hypothetical protein BKA82DRAFT_4326433 [Pisolithus tinctorius]